MRGLVRTLPPPDSAPCARRASPVACRRPPEATHATGGHLRGRRDADRTAGLPASMQAPVRGVHRAVGRQGRAKGVAGAAIPLPVRIVHVARDAAFQRCSAASSRRASRRERAGGAFDPAVAALLADHAAEILAPDPDTSAWDETLAAEPGPRLTLGRRRSIARWRPWATSPTSSRRTSRATRTGVAELPGRGGAVRLRPPPEARAPRAAPRPRPRTRRGARPDLAAGPLTRRRLGARPAAPVPRGAGAAPLPVLAGLGAVAGAHHERLDGSGYHRGRPGAALSPAARLLAAADAYHAMTEPRPFRGALRRRTPPGARRRGAARAGWTRTPSARSSKRPDSARPAIHRPAGLTEREAEVLGLLARGLQTKEVARALGISAKTADHHIQNAYAKIGVSTRAAAALFAMEHGLAAWGELPMVERAARP